VLVYGDYYLAHTAQSVTISPRHFGSHPPMDWALDGSSGGSGRAKLISPLGSVKQRDDVGYDLSVHYLQCAAATEAMIAGVPPMVDAGYVEGAEVIVVAFGTPGKYVRAAVRQLRAEGVAVGYVRPITLFPFPTDTIAAAADGVRAVAVYENNQGQMIDDVRLSVLGRAPVHFIGGLSLDSSGFGVAPDLDVAAMMERIRAVVSEPDRTPVRAGVRVGGST
jgi:2-oxoglutarate ferredoxin oxidoreductase subunit alpha